MPFYERQPYIQPLHQVVKEVLEGEIRIPKFQRPGTEETWNAEKRGDLLDSIYRGFPIGTILLWSAKQPIRTMDTVGGFKIPPPKDSSGPQRLLLDGHQRLSTLVQILGSSLLEEINNKAIDTQKEERESWFFELSPEKEGIKTSRDRFILLKKGQNSENTHIPIKKILNRSELNKWIREHEKYLDNKMIEEADILRDRIREYSIPVAVLVTDALNEATESFKRINSSGVRMDDFNMFSALSYQEDFDAQEIFEEYRTEILVPIHWEGVSDLDVLRICASLSGGHPSNFDIAETANELKSKKETIRQAFESIQLAADFLKNQCGVHGRRALPYAWQLITIAIHLAGNKNGIGKQTEEAMKKWFWLTTYGEVFGGFKDKTYDRSREALFSMIQGGSWDVMERDVTRKVEMISRFDFRAARTKAFALSMARCQDNDDLSGKAHQSLAGGVDSMGVVYLKKGKRSIWWHLAILTSEESLTEYRDAVNAVVSGNYLQEIQFSILEKLGFPTPINKKMNIEEFFQERQKVLLKKEAQFIEELGLDASELKDQEFPNAELHALTSDTASLRSTSDR